MVSVEAGVVLDQWEDAISFEEVAVDDVVLDAVAVVHDKGEVHHQSCEVAIFIAAVRVVRRDPVVGPELVLVQTVDDDSSAGAVGIGSVVFVAAHCVQLLFVDAVGIHDEIDDGVGVVGVDQRVFAAREEQGEQQ